MAMAPSVRPDPAAIPAAASLAGDFGHVDQTGDPGRFVACLRLLSAIPFFRDYKTAARAALRLEPGGRVLEVGCGLGRDLGRCQTAVGPDGLAVGLDVSRIMLDEARRSRDAAGPGPVFVTGDVSDLPFADAVFDACLVDRTLQHVADPFRALAEMARVTRPGGRVVAVEPDWDGYVLDSPDPEAAGIVAGAWRDGFASGRVGRCLARGLAEGGLTVTKVQAETFVLRDFATADAIYDIGRTVAAVAASGALGRERGAAFLAGLAAADARGLFLSGLTFFCVVGEKPGV